MASVPSRRDVPGAAERLKESGVRGRGAEAIGVSAPDREPREEVREKKGRAGPEGQSPAARLCTS